MTLVALPVHDRVCSNCEHAYFGAQGVFCMEFRENVPESAASDCPSFDVIPSTNGTPPPQRPEVNHSVEVVAKVDVPETGGKGVEVITEETLVDACDRFLANRHCVLWGQPFEIITPKGRREAAEWLAEQIKGLGALTEEAPA